MRWRIKPADRQRIQRALEVFRITGCPISQLQALPEAAQGIRWLRIALVPGERSALYAGLDQRFAAMLDNGLVAEVSRLRELPLMSANCPAMRAVGYRQIWSQLSGDITPTEAQRQAAVATRRLAKRQMTWLRSELVELSIEPFCAGAFEKVAEMLDSAGVSHCGQRCNIMEQPIKSREHGV